MVGNLTPMPWFFSPNLAESQPHFPTLVYSELLPLCFRRAYSWEMVHRVASCIFLPISEILLGNRDTALEFTSQAAYVR